MFKNLKEDKYLLNGEEQEEGVPVSKGQMIQGLL